MKEYSIPDGDTVALLSQTLHPSATINFILPARIRNSYHNDIVFVGDHIIQLREYLPTGHLTGVLAKFDVDDPILGANVVGSGTDPDRVVNEVIKQESEQDLTCKNGVHEAERPLQVVVLSTAASGVLFLYAKTRLSCKVDFVFARSFCYPSYQSTPARWGKHVAVDHQ